MEGNQSELHGQEVTLFIHTNDLVPTSLRPDVKSRKEEATRHLNARRYQECNKSTVILVDSYYYIWLKLKQFR